MGIELRRAIASVALLIAGTGVAPAQTAGFVPGGREIFAMDFSKVPVGEFPKELTLLKGKPQVVDKNGTRMLRASEPTEMLVRLGENLPEAFTLEFDLIPKACCAPEDISFEGTPAMARSSTSANVSWQRETIIVVGGGEYFQMPMPQDLAEVLPSAPTKVNVSFDASGMQLYTNDRLVTTLAGRKFAHGRVLRVFLGGQDDNDHAVYLGRLRIGAGGTPPTIAGSSGPTPQTSSASSTTTTDPSLATTTSMQNEPRSGFAVTVTMGSAGPLVSWPAVPQAGGYAVSRAKVGDVTCCNNSSGRGYTAVSPWQDQPLPSSGTYSYLVIANTPAGIVRAETQFAYTAPAPVTAVMAAPTTTTATGMVTTSPTPTGGTIVGGAPSSTLSTATTSGTSGSTSSGPGGSLTCAATTSPTTMTSTATAGATGCPPWYQVTLTGFRVQKTTSEPSLAPDGRYDEAYAAAAVIVWNRKTSTVVSRSAVRTVEYGDIADGKLYGTRIKAGTQPSGTGGIWTGNGPERVPMELDPTGTALPQPAADRFPLFVWEGTLTAGTEAVLVVPTIWDRDIDSSPFSIWRQNWIGSPLSAFFANPLVQSEMLDTRFVPTNPQIDVGMPFLLTTPDAQAHIKDRPIGVVPVPPVLPVTVNYFDRHVMITQEKLTSLAVGTSTTLAVELTEPASIATGASYTLYLRVERKQ